MAWKFLSIGKANAEIDRLNAEVLKITTERDDAVKALEANTSEVAAQAEKLQADLLAVNAVLATANTEVNKLTAELATVKAELQTAQARIANPPAEIVAIASHQAAAITGAQGQPPIAASPAGSPAGATAAGTGAELLTQYTAIKDPSAQTLFFRKHQAAILAASLAERAGE